MHSATCHTHAWACSPACNRQAQRASLVGLSSQKRHDRRLGCEHGQKVFLLLCLHSGRARASFSALSVRSAACGMPTRCRRTCHHRHDSSSLFTYDMFEHRHYEQAGRPTSLLLAFRGLRERRFPQQYRLHMHLRNPCQPSPSFSWQGVRHAASAWQTRFCTTCRPTVVEQNRSVRAGQVPRTAWHAARQ